MKPVTLMSYPIKNSTMTNGVVLDPFLGSGSTLIACMETDRVCMGIELDPKFVDVIVKRSIAQNDGRYDDVFVIRDGQKLMFDEVVTFEPEEAHE
jgi:site-specific DNA-methyltransferase (adenine-specific)